MHQPAFRRDGTARQGVIPAIGDYALIGESRIAALVSSAGSIDWLCLRHFSGPSVFAALLDRERGGRFSITPAVAFKESRRYLPGTAVLETTFVTGAGKARLIDLMPVGERAGMLRPMREILRIVEGVEGEVTLDVLFEPRPNYAREPPCIRSRGALGWACTGRRAPAAANRGSPHLRSRDRCGGRTSERVDRPAGLLLARLCQG